MIGLINKKMPKLFIFGSVALALFVVGMWFAKDMKIGDSEVGVPELRPQARYKKPTRSGWLFFVSQVHETDR